MGFIEDLSDPDVNAIGNVLTPNRERRVNEGQPISGADAGYTESEDTEINEGYEGGLTGDMDTTIFTDDEGLVTADNPIPGGGSEEASHGPLDWFSDTFTGGPDTGGGGAITLDPRSDKPLDLSGVPWKLIMGTIITGAFLWLARPVLTIIAGVTE